MYTGATNESSGQDTNSGNSVSKSVGRQIAEAIQASLAKGMNPDQISRIEVQSIDSDEDDTTNSDNSNNNNNKGSKSNNNRKNFSVVTSGSATANKNKNKGGTGPGVSGGNKGRAQSKSRSTYYINQSDDDDGDDDQGMYTRLIINKHLYACVYINMSYMSTYYYYA